MSTVDVASVGPIHLAACFWGVRGNPYRRRGKTQHGSCSINIQPVVLLSFNAYFVASMSVKRKIVCIKNNLSMDILLNAS